jgi:hypothetical protein
MMNWITNKPNARFWVLKLLKDSFHPGDQLVETSIGSRDLAAQAFLTPTGQKLLLVNKRSRAFEVELGDATKASALTVDGKSGDGPARAVKPIAGKLDLEPFSVTVVSW